MRIDGDGKAIYELTILLTPKEAQAAEVEPEKEGQMSEKQAQMLLQSMKDEEQRVQLDERRAARHSKDAVATAFVLVIRATVAAQAGEKDLAIQQLEISAQAPNGVDYGDLKLNPMWDPLRGDPRFEKIVASLAPRETISK